MRTGGVTLLAAVATLTAPTLAQDATPPPPYANQLTPRQDESWWTRELENFRTFPHRDRYRRLMAQGEWQAAAKELEAILEITPRADPVRFELVKLHYGHGRPEEARVWAKRLIRRQPTFAPAFLYRGIIHYETGRPGTARKDLNRALALGGLAAADRRKAEDLLARMTLEQAFVAVETPLRPLQRPAPDIHLGRVPDLPEPADDTGIAAATPPAFTHAFDTIQKNRPDTPPEEAQKAESEVGDSPAKRAAAWRKRGYRAMESGDPDRAIKAFEAALASGRETPSLVAQLGYAHLAAGDLRAAEAALSRAAPELAEPGPVYEDIAYIHKGLNRPKAAAQNFRRAIDTYGEDGQTARARPLKQEVEWIADRFDAGLYTLLRADTGIGRPSPLERNLQQSQGGVSLEYLPEGAGYDTGTHAKIFGRLLWSYRQDTLRLEEKSVQGGIGIKLRPLAAHDMIVSVERLISVGRAARDDWMLRVGYSFAHGLSPRLTGVNDGRLAARAYLDGALIDPGTPDLYGSGEARVGWAWQPGTATILWPHAVVAANVQDDRFGDATLVEAGAGMTFHVHFGESRYRWGGNTLELSIQYRQKVTGDSTGGSGVVFLLSLRH